MNWIKALFKGRQRDRSSRNEAPPLRFEPGGLKPMGDIPRYPPFTEGLPAASPEQLLATQESLIRQLKHELALTPDQEKTLVYPLLLSYASFVHLLPASKGHHHRGAGGMLRHGLEVALWATRGFHGKIIDGHESGERRKIMEPRWRLAVAVAGLCHDLGKAAYDLVVTDASGKKVWDVYGGLLTEWVEAEQLDRYFISWRAGREHKLHERFGHLLTMRVIPREVLSFMNEGDPKIIAVMHETIAGQIPKGPAKVVHELVMAADQRSVQRDIKGQRVADSDAALGVPVAKYLVDAMKRLIDEGRWKANQEGQPLWVGGGGVYLHWELAVPDVIDLLTADGIAGIPRSPGSIAESLGDFDVIKKHINSDGHETFYVPIAPEKLCSSKKVPTLSAVELTGLDILFDGPQPAPMEIHAGPGAIAAREERNQKREEKLAGERNDRALKRVQEKAANSSGVSMPVMGPQSAESSASDSDEEVTFHQAPLAEPADLAALEAAASHAPVPGPAPRDVPTKEAGNVSADKPEADRPGWIERLTADQREVIERCFIPGKSPHARVLGDEVVLMYPDGMALYEDDRNAKLELIKPLLAEHPAVPGKPTQKRDIQRKSTNVLVLNEEAAQAVRALMPAKPPASRKKPKPAKAKPQTPPPATEPEQASAPQPAKEATTTPPAAAKAEPRAAQKKPARAKTQKPKPQQPPAPTPDQSNNLMLVEMREKVLAEYPNQKIEDSQTGGYWVSAPDAAQWYVKQVRPDLSLGLVLSALYELKAGAGQQPPNQDQDFVLVNRTN